MNQRLMIYRRIAAARGEDELTRIMEEIAGSIRAAPVPVLNLADYGRIRVMADQLGIESIEREGAVVAIRFREKAKVDPDSGGHPGAGTRDLQLIPPVTLKVDLKKPSTPPPSGTAAAIKQAHEAGGHGAGRGSSGGVRARNRPGGRRARRRGR